MSLRSTKIYYFKIEEVIKMRKKRFDPVGFVYVLGESELGDYFKPGMTLFGFGKGSHSGEPRSEFYVLFESFDKLKRLESAAPGVDNNEADREFIDSVCNWLDLGFHGGSQYTLTLHNPDVHKLRSIQELKRITFSEMQKMRS